MNKQDQKKEKVYIGLIVFLFVIGFAAPFLLPFIIIIAVIAGVVNQKKKENKREFDYDKSYYNKKDQKFNEALFETKKLEEQYLNNNRYKKDDASKHYFERKTTAFDKHHAHENMYPKEEKKVVAKVIKETPIKDEEALKLYHKQLRELKKEYDDFKIGIIEFRERKQVIQDKINLIKNKNKNASSK